MYMTEQPTCARDKAKQKLDATYAVYEAARVSYLKACDELEAIETALGYRYTFQRL